MKYILFVCACMMIACSREDDVKADLDASRYELEDGPAGSYAHEIYDYKQKTGVTVWRTPGREDFAYNFDALNQVDMEPCGDDETILKKGFQVYREIFIDLYPEDFQRKYFPCLLIMADTVFSLDYDGVRFKPLKMFGAPNFLALGRINRDIDDVFTPEELENCKTEMNTAFWTAILSINQPRWIMALNMEFQHRFPVLNKYTWPIPEGASQEDIARLKKKCEKEIYSLGKLHFVVDVYSSKILISTEVNFPKSELSAFLKLVIENSEDELQLFLNGDGMEKIKEKFEVLRTSIKNYFDYDLLELSK